MTYLYHIHMAFCSGGRTFRAVLVIIIVTAGTAHAQDLVLRKTPGWQIAIHLGPTAYVGDREATYLDRGASGLEFGAETVHRFTSVAGIGVRINSLNHPRFVDSDQRRSSLEAIVRLQQPAPALFAPYVDAGIHHIVGAGKGGSGPVAGAGLNVRVRHSFSVFSAVHVNFVYPGNIIDDSNDPDHFDAYVAARLGLRITDLSGFLGRRPSIDIGGVMHDDTIVPGKPAVFSVALVSPHPSDRIIWDFGDGDTGAGNPAVHVFLNSGAFQAQVKVSNETGESIERFPVFVGGPPATANIMIPPSDWVVPEARWIDLDNVTILHPHMESAGSEQTTGTAVTESPDAPPRVQAAAKRGWGIVVASRRDLAVSRSIAAAYRETFPRVTIISADVQGDTWYRVVLGLFDTREAALDGKASLPASAPADAWPIALEGQTTLPIDRPATSER